MSPAEAQGIKAQSLERLIVHVARWTGFAPDFIQRGQLEAAAMRLISNGALLSNLLERAANDDQGLKKAFADAISVGETFFFRQHEHFDLAVEQAADFARSDRRVFRAWSAGCASGEEAYSLAASLLSVDLKPGKRIEVLGTDFAEMKLFAAREATYGRWSVRASGPMLFPTLEPTAAGLSKVVDRVRSICQFETHNLLDAPPGDAFDLVFCRNVLLYFGPAAAQQALVHLVSSLTPTGVLVLGPMDASATPVGLQRLGPPELNAFRRAPATAASVRKPVTARPPEAVTARVAAATVGPIDEHLEAMGHLDRGRLDLAEALLARLGADYLPGLLERALLFDRRGHPERARALMQQVLAGVRHLADDTLVDGPQKLPALYFRSTAAAYVARIERRRIER